MVAVKQAMVRVGARHVRLLVAGRGAPALLLHGSPNNADALLPLMERLRPDFLVIAPDTPGNGASDPLLPEQPQAERYVDALVALLDVLKLPQVAVYGFHTGAVFAAELARRHPSRVTAAVCDGYPLWTDAEAEELDERYLAPVAPRADGTHLSSLWSRAIDQNWYFPWHLRDEARRIDRDLNDSRRLHERVMDLLQAGDAFRTPYAAALKADGAERLLEVKAPTLITSAAADVLSQHLPRVPGAKRIRVERSEDAEHVFARTADWFKRHPPARSKLALPLSLRRFIDLPQGQIYVAGEAAAAAVWLHDAGESSAQAPSEAANGAGGGVLRLDLPGHGLSTAPWPETDAELLETLRRGLAAAGVDLRNCAISGKGLGRQVAELINGDRSALEAQPMQVPDIAPRWDGGHLSAAWHFSRFRSQYQPWFQRGSGARLAVPLPSAEALQQKTFDVLRTGQETLALTLPFSCDS